MDSARSALVRAARAWAPLDEAQADRLAEAFGERTAEAGTPVALPGSEAHEVLFVTDGLLRFYYPGADGKESNKAFVGEGEFAGALAAAGLGVPIAYGIEALEPTRYLAAPYARWTALLNGEPALERLGRKLAEHLLMRKELRARSFLLHDASERYRALVDARPDLVQRVSQYHLASYLGVTDVHLSRVRRGLVLNKG
ncbi:Crp/Fnr family transcriptional regulator [Rubrivirga sp.]|uniref:Crp/Fnr family transcriptional regulator n=1 Tax=Rubrivirga sp. TaxID=1885344 RepID=UPI003B528D38